MSSYVTLRLDGGPEKVWRCKGVDFATGAEVEVPADVAGLVLAAAGPRKMTVVKGEPAEIDRRPEGVKAQAKAAAELRSKYAADVDHGGLFAEVKPLSAGAMAALKAADKDALAAVEAGKADDDRVGLAMAARLLGRAELAKAALRRTNPPKAV